MRYRRSGADVRRAAAEMSTAANGSAADMRTPSAKVSPAAGSGVSRGGGAPGGLRDNRKSHD